MYLMIIHHLQISHYKTKYYHMLEKKVLSGLLIVLK